tara:strand:- start:120 stop:422 length:303 start_codon:yes stop_codon:yes gene_type:complete
MKKVIFFSLFFIINSANGDELLKKGREIFLNQGNCVSCHSLSDAKSNSNIGPNLNQIMPTKDKVLAAVNRGIGVMPAYEGILTTEEIDSVAHYVSEVASQ